MSGMTSLIRLTLSGFLQLLRSRVYLNILVAGVALVVAALLFDELGGGAGGRVLLDVGPAFVALVVATLAGVLAITGLTRDIETKQAHLVLSRPVARWQFVVARFLTTALLIVLTNVLLGALIAGLLVLTAAPAPFASVAFVTCVFASLEAFIIAAIAIFFGTGSSSTMSAVFTATLFLLGRLTGEMAVIIERGTFPAATPVLKIVYAALPHLTAFDLTKLAHAGDGDDGAMSAADIALTGVYGLTYAGAFLAAAAFRFTRRDLL